LRTRMVNAYKRWKEKLTRHFRQYGLHGRMKVQMVILDIEKAITSISDTKILVVIGYSFPLFNRALDRQIFKGIHWLKN